MVKIGVHLVYGSYRKNKIGVPFFWTTLHKPIHITVGLSADTGLNAFYFVPGANLKSFPVI